ncbi:chromosome alignment-maintaining phosphoprotein 1 isoform X2 [Ovis aries]|uniref:chromosome alignment-maintaining phosphoprotein 1 isoform X2 n=1 Tax=Ovis aries TaxID=9940 RepID=UPI0029527D1E|nr:chromosome alignment-maintaining phosphoprotein 1 isoform X2 [Ovis aries]
MPAAARCIKIHASGVDEFLASIFASCWLWKHLPCRTLLRCLKKWYLLARGPVNMMDEAKLLAQFTALLKRWLCGMWLDVIVEKNRALSVDRRQLQALQLRMRLVNLLSIHLRCHDFAGIQKAVVDPMGSKPPNDDHDLFLVQVWL